MNKTSGFFSYRGFTLIELLVVIAVIGVLAVGTITLINPLTQIQKANDAQRKSDLKQIQNALESYYNDNSKYPDSLTFGSPWGNYMSQVPNDPTPSKNYSYSSALSGQGYYLYASLDRETNILSNLPSGATCGTLPIVCNYGVSSSNTKP